jgi:Flp pilus assembly protein TadG
MRNLLRRRRLSERRARRGAVIVEFALVVPFISLIVFGVIDFSRAYGQLNALDSALREGTRYGSTIRDDPTTDYTTIVKTKVQEYATQYGFNGLNTALITVNRINNAGGTLEAISTTATAHPIPLQILNRFLGVPNLSVTRTVVFRYTCAAVSGPMQCR